MQHQIVSRETWLEARAALLVKEKAATRAYDQLSAEQRALPWVRIEKDYAFDGPSGKVTLSQLFDGKSQLFTKTFMLEPGQTHQCVGCSLEVDHMAGLLEHLNNNDVAYAVVAGAPIAEIELMRQRMDWRFPWVSSFGSDFASDICLGFGMPGAPAGNNVFYKDETGQIFHTYANYGRGGEAFLGIYRILDLMPKGRNENGPYHTLADWARPRNLYGAAGTVAHTGEFRPSTADSSEAAMATLGWLENEVIRPYRAMAYNNAWCNYRLLGACAQISQDEFVAKRTGFFPSLRATLNHILVIDQFYVDAMEGGTLGPTAWADPEPYLTVASLWEAQSDMDRRLLAIVGGLEPDSLQRKVAIRRETAIQQERMDRLLLHLFQHQIHHRGQAHAMLSGTTVRPPQLDEFFSASEVFPARA